MAKSVEDKAGTVVARCDCTSHYQDAKYGQGMRVFNLKAKKETGKMRCTNCGRVKN